MNTLVLLLMLVATDVGRARTVEVPRSIERTIIRVAVGFAASLGDEEGLSSVARMFEGESPSVHVLNPRLYVDGVRDGSPSLRICRSLKRLACFSLHLSGPGESVELRYLLLYRGFAVRRGVVVSQGRIESSASFPCAMGPQQRVRHVTVGHVARETKSGTTITTTTNIKLNTGICNSRSASRLRIVNRLAGRMAGEQIDAALKQATDEGQRLSNAGHDFICGTATRFIRALLSRWD